MAVNPFWVEKSIRIGDIDSDTSYVDLLQGTGVPGGDAGEQDEALVGSIYFRKDTGDHYRKVTTTNAPVDWKRISSDEASDMFLTSAYDNTTNGDAADGDSVEEAIGKIDANQRDLTTLSGEAQGAVDHGTFSGSTIQDNRNTRQALQDLETGLESISGGGKDQALGVTTATRVGAVLVDDAFQAEWEVVVEDAADPSNRRSIKLNALHDGTASADATQVDHARFARNRVGSNFNFSLDVTLAGAAGTQDFAVEVASTEPSGVNVYVRRTQLA